MHILRTALLGLVLAFLFLAGMFFGPGRAGEDSRIFSLFRNQSGSKVTDDDLPPALFPAFSDDLNGGEQLSGPHIHISLEPLHREMSEGTTARFILTVRNTGDSELQNLYAEERLDESIFSIQGKEVSRQEKNLVVWQIPPLASGETWNTEFSLTARPTTTPEPFETTAFVRGEDIDETPGTSRMATSTISIVSLPKTGVENVALRSQLSSEQY